MTAQALLDLQAIVDRLGPDMWLVMDRMAFPRYFGTGSRAVETAQAFFSRNGCACFFEDKKTEPSVRFWRVFDRVNRDAYKAD
jgi:hypothetical protein